jgi:hypothetical protein
VFSGVTGLKQSIYVWPVYMDIENNMNLISHRNICTEFVFSTEMEYLFDFDKFFDSNHCCIVVWFYNNIDTEYGF